MGEIIFVNKPVEFDGCIARGEGAVLAGVCAVGIDAGTIDVETTADGAEEIGDVLCGETGFGNALEG